MSRDDVLGSIVDCDADKYLDSTPVPARVDTSITVPDMSTHIPTQSAIEFEIQNTIMENIAPGDVIWLHLYVPINELKPNSMGYIVLSDECGLELTLYLMNIAVYGGEKYAQFEVRGIQREPGFPEIINGLPMVETESKAYRYVPEEKPWVKQGKRKKGGRRKY